MIKQLTNNEREVLEYFAQRPENIHIRGLSEKLDMPYPSVRKALTDLECKGIVESDKKAKMMFYSPTNEKFRKAKKLTNLEKLGDSGLVEFLEEELRPEALVLFGSYLEGRDGSESDIDVAVIGGRDKNLDLSEYRKELGREINLTQIQEVENENKEFKNTLANGLVLQGYLELI